MTSCGLLVVLPKDSLFLTEMLLPSSKRVHRVPVSFKADWVIYTAVIYLWMKNISDDKLVRNEIHRQNLFNVQAPSPGMAKCGAQDRGAPFVP